MGKDKYTLIKTKLLLDLVKKCYLQVTEVFKHCKLKCLCAKLVLIVVVKKIDANSSNVWYYHLVKDVKFKLDQHIKHLTSELYMWIRTKSSMKPSIRCILDRPIKHSDR